MSDLAVGEDFPQVCETCLGPNPYVRMVKLRYGDRMCKISNLPYQAFKWKAGTGGRMKETIISFTVAKERDICQTCLNDMKYGLPVGLRDKLLAQVARQGAGEIARSGVGLRYQYQQAVEDGGGSGGAGFGGSAAVMGLIGNGPSGSSYTYASESNAIALSLDPANQQAALQLDVFAKAKASLEARNKTAFRNLPKLCSFWVAGTCSRVLRKVCQFRPCCGQFVFPEIASNREMHSALVTKLEAEGAAEVMTTLDNETRLALKSYNVGVNRDEAIRKRVLGQDDLSNKYMGQIKHHNPDLEPPVDQTITTLWVGRIDDEMNETSVRDAIYSFLPTGVTAQSVRVHVLRAAKCAFLEFDSRDIAEAVASKVQRKLVVAGKVCPFDWAKPKPAASEGGGEGVGGASTKRARTDAMPAPPGLEGAPVSTYSLQGLPAPSVGVDAVRGASAKAAADVTGADS